MSTAVPFCESIGIDVPAHYDAGDRARTSSTARSRGSSTSEEKRWLTEEGEITWDQVLERWRRRGPANEELVEMIQRGRLQRLAVAA